MSGSIEYVPGPVARLIIDRPEKRNAVTPAMSVALCDRLEEADRDPQVRAVVLTGRGDHFSAGHDLKVFSPEWGAREWMELIDRQVRTEYLSVLEFSKPIVAEVRGYACAGFAEVPLLCDFVVASETAVFDWRFLRSAGVIPSFVLPALGGWRLANRVYLLGETLSARQALEAGLLTEVVADDELEDATARLADALAEREPWQLRFNKRALGFARQQMDPRGTMLHAAALDVLSNLVRAELDASRETRSGA